MPLELIEPDVSIKAAFPGNRGFLVLVKLKNLRNVTRESLKRLRALTVEYCKERYPEELEKLDNGEEPMEQSEPEPPTSDGDANAEENKDEKKDEKKDDPNEYPKSPIKFGPTEMMYDNCCFVVCNLADPSDFAHFIFSKMCDDPAWPRPRFPLRIMPVHEICCLSPKAIEMAVTPLLTSVFGGEEAIRFSIVIHGKAAQDNREMPRSCIETIVRNIIWSINPNCVQCIKFQDYAVMLEVIDPMLFFGVAKEFNQLGRYNTWAVHLGRNKKETEEDSEDDISDDPELSESDNIKKKLKTKKQRRLAKQKEEKAAAELASGETVVEETNGN